MHNDSMSEVIRAVRLALGRTSPLTAPPTPPQIDETITRLVHTDIGLPELFARTAQANKMGVETVSPEELAPKLIAFLQARNVKTIALAGSKLLRDLCLPQSLRQAGLEAPSCDQLTLDELYDIDCGITDVWAAVAEVGALVVRGSPEHTRALSLVPPIHVAVVEPKNLMPDLVDLFQRLPKTPNEKLVLITGPSKTADIEMNLVTGVHGPGVVQVFLLQ
ncbi:LutC/YkgG family protein [Fontivita pretiosa]|uniref:LutC/YkgG family protein n=1 Tax=Fontivita pretiosa TaxID=2989684 RepID=UPI003D162C37